MGANPESRSSRPAEGASSRASSSGPRLPESVTSRENRWLKQFRAAFAGQSSSGEAPKVASSPDGEIAAIEGVRLLEAALGASRGLRPIEIIAVLASESGERHLARLGAEIPSSARLLRTTDRLFAQIAATEAPQGIAALVRLRAATLDELVSGVPLILVLAGLQDPGNVGVMIRSAEALGATGAAACTAGGIGTANPFAPKALRASAGSALRLPILRAASAPVLIAQLRVARVRVIAACAHDVPTGKIALAPWEANWRGSVALLVGNEGAGLPPDVVRSADQVVRIPQAAQRNGAESAAESLNAAVAGGVLLYEAARQRGLR